MRRFLPVHRIAPLLPTFFIACLGSKMHFQPDEMDRRWKFSGWKGFRHQVWQITSVARKSNLDSLMDPSPSFLRRGPKSKLPIDQGRAATATRRTQALMGLNAPKTSAPAESSSSGGVYGAPQTYATPPPLNTPPMAGIPSPFSHSCQASFQGTLSSLLLYRLVLITCP